MGTRFKEVLWSLVLVLLLQSVAGVKRHDFKTCSQSGFCARNRGLADRAHAHSSEWTSPYSIVGAPSFQHGKFKAAVSNGLFDSIKFELQLHCAKDGTFRLKMDEVDGLRQRYNQADQWALVHDAFKVDTESATFSASESESKITFKSNGNIVEIEHNPIKITFKRADGVPQVVLNGRGLFNMEHYRIKQIPGDDSSNTTQEAAPINPAHEKFKHFLPETEDGMWEEHFGNRPDTKPKGPESLGLDITFPGYAHVMGIPEHASPLNLKNTRGSPAGNSYTDPYRLFNLDVFEYEHDSEMALYGAIPFMQAHRPGSTVGVFWLNAAETWVDIERSSTDKSVLDAFKKRKNKDIVDSGPAMESANTHWFSESGILDLFVFLGPTVQDVTAAYAKLTGTTAMPQYFAIGYHQCRWNYLTDEDVKQVSEKFDEHDIPMDVMWLDIEYSEDHKYFIWDQGKFPNPEGMQDHLAARGRQLVAIVDPHLKRDNNFRVYKEAQDLDILVKDKDGKEFDGWCWPGSSAWIDHFNPVAWDWWASNFKYDKFIGAKENMYIWNDMNEPSVFNTPEITMPRDNIHYGGWEHRDVHNINGMLYHNHTAQGLIVRDKVPRRPFVLSRAFFSGSQRISAIWTGDNMCTWEHLEGAPAMVLANNIAGMSFSGADVGGFFGNPSEEMSVRWYQTGAFFPFFRAHAHIDTKRREPYLFDEPYRGYMREMIRLRYILLPAWYTAFWEASLYGYPIIRPNYYVFPQSDNIAEDQQFWVGSSGLLVKPNNKQGTDSVEVYLADAQPYYNYFTHDIIFGSATGGTEVTVPAPIDVLPLFHHGGSILPRRDLVRRSAPLHWRDPITLVVASDLTGSKANGSLYLDDGETYSFESGDFIYRGFEMSGTSGESLKIASFDMTARPEASIDAQKSFATYNADNAFAKSVEPVTIEEIIVLGLASKPTCISIAGKTTGLEFDWKDGVAATGSRRKGGVGKAATKLVIKTSNYAGLSINKDWTIELEFSSSKFCSVAPATSKSPVKELASSDVCPLGQFLCQNKGHSPACILTSRVNDGICDEECCDGSDEFDGKVKCADRCTALGAEKRKEAEELARRHRVGSQIRKEWEAFGKKEQKQMEQNVAKIRLEIVDLKARELAAKKYLDEIEKMEQGEIERKKGTVLYSKIEDYQQAVGALKDQRLALKTAMEELEAILSDLKSGYNPNYQDMAVLGAARSFVEWRKKFGRVPESDEETTFAESEGETGESKTYDEIHAIAITDELSDDQLDELEHADILHLMNSVEPVAVVKKPSFLPSTTLFNIVDYIPETLQPTYHVFRKQFIKALTEIGFLTGESGAPTAASPESDKARAAHTKAQNAVEDAEDRLKKIENSLEKDWGLGWQFKKLDGSCISKETGDYTYELCFQGTASQKEKRTHAHTTLGTFSGWDDSKPAGSTDRYLKQHYTNGQRCWQGPNRSVDVELICGTSNALLSVSEPEKCTYLYKVQTPAICYELTEGETVKSEHIKNEL